MHRKTFSLGKRSHKSHVSGSIVLEIQTGLPSHAPSMALFRSIRSLPQFCSTLCPTPAKNPGLTDALTLMNKELGIGKEKEENAAKVEMVEHSVQTITEDALAPKAADTPSLTRKLSKSEYPWEERYDATSGFNYYFNTTTLVSQWEKPESFDEDFAAAALKAANSRNSAGGAVFAPTFDEDDEDEVVSTAPDVPHPSMHERPSSMSAMEDLPEPPAARKPPPTLAERLAAANATADAATLPPATSLKSEGSVDSTCDGSTARRQSRRHSKLINLGSSLRMTLTWGSPQTQVFDGSEEPAAIDESATPLNPTADQPPLERRPFPTTLPPTETEMVEDMSWRVVLSSSPEATNGIRLLGILVLTNYRLLFIPEETLLESFDPEHSVPGSSSGSIEIPVMLIGEIDVTSSSQMSIRTKDSREYFFQFCETHQSETEEDLLEMEMGRESEDKSGSRFSSAMSSIKDMGSAASSSVKPKKRNQMNGGGGFKGFLNMASMAKITQSITAKVRSLGTDSNQVKSKQTAGDASNFASTHLEPNGRTKLENFLAGSSFNSETAGVPRTAALSPPLPHTAPPRLYTKLPWTDEDIDVVQGVQSDDGSGLRRISTRLKFRLFNAQFETQNWLNIHKRLCESLSRAAIELGGKVDGEGEDDEQQVEIRISGYDYVGTVEGDEYPEAADDTRLNVSKDWIMKSHKIIQDGWKVYDIEAEYKRMGVPNENFRISRINKEFAFSPTYPDVWAVPNTVTDKQLEKAGKHRSKVRMPVLTFVHPVTKASISRCSQPMVGISNHRNAEDENLLEQYRLVSGDPKKASKLPIVIIDARPKVNAQVNQAAGKGFELTKFYPNSELLFMNIGNIHTMRKSVESLADTCCGRGHDGSSYLAALDNGQWLYHLHKVLRAAVHTAHLVSRRGISCVVHCSDGWDRTAQICALSELIMDPYYRTFKGFQVLVEKDWLTFGHKFADRNGFHPNGGHHSQERSPVFIQFLDCVHQMVLQNPAIFEFNVAYLVEMCRQSHMGWFGNFLFNTMKERVENKLTETSISLWTYLDANKGKYSNPNYRAAAGTIQIDSSPKVMQVWREWFMVWHDMEFALMWEQEGKEDLGAEEAGEEIVENIRKTRRSSAIEKSLMTEDIGNLEEEVISDEEGEGGHAEGQDSDDDEEGALTLPGHYSLKSQRESARVPSARLMASNSRERMNQEQQQQQQQQQQENYASDED
jgi:hypothetical protein